MILISNVHLDELLKLSVAVTVTVVSPNGNWDPDAELYVIVGVTPLVSVAVAEKMTT